MRIGDWNSDVCSSDLHESLVLDITGIYRRRWPGSGAARSQRQRAYRGPALANRAFAGPGSAAGLSLLRDPVHCAACAGLDKRRSEERRVGKSVSVRVDLGVRRIIKNKKTNTK